jgi:hypothetical protein
MKPDITIYPPDLPQRVYTSATGGTFSHFGFAELVIEVKLKVDPFNDKSKGSKTSSFVIDHLGSAKSIREATKSLGQIVAYAAETCARQHRVFCYSVLVVGGTARLLRWDRSGVIVSESFDYTVKDHLHEFFWRFSHASYEKRGFDTTIRPATEAEEVTFTDALKRRLREDVPFLYEGQPLPNEKIEELTVNVIQTHLAIHYQSKRVTAITVHHTNDDGTSGAKEFLVSRPVASPRTLVCRGTRGYWAVDPSDNQVVFLKDTWRYEVDAMEKEGDILTKLDQLKITGIPIVKFHGDVRGKRLDLVF